MHKTMNKEIIPVGKSEFFSDAPLLLIVGVILGVVGVMLCVVGVMLCVVGVMFRVVEGVVLFSGGSKELKTNKFMRFLSM